MKFKIAICDDEQNQIDYMASIVASWSAHAGHNCEIRTFASAEAFLFEYEEDKAFDILLLDIEMENMNGIELAKRIRKDHNRAEIIFITSHSVFENKVSDDFYRIHRSYLVSLKYITRISRTSVTIGNSTLPLSRGKYDDINRAFIEHN